MTITNRETKGSALTYAEMDENFRDLRFDTDLTRILENGNTTTLSASLNDLSANTISGSVIATNEDIENELSSKVITPSNSLQVFKKHNLIQSSVQTAIGGETGLEFTGIDPAINKITISFRNLSSAGNETLRVQLGGDTSYEITGYVSATSAGTSSAYGTTGFIIGGTGTGDLRTGHMIITRVPGTETWISSHTAMLNTSGVSIFGGGSYTMTQPITRLKIVWASSNTFDAGSTAFITTEY